MIGKATNNINFKAGLSSNAIILQHKIDCKRIESLFYSKQNITANFSNNKPLALAIFIANNIMEFLNKNFNFSRLFAPSINVYNPKDLLLDKNLYHFCLPDNRIVLKNNLEYKAGSIFYQNINNLEELDLQREQAYKLGLKGSNHFLADILHEMMHSTYLKIIFDKCNKQSLDKQDLLFKLQNKTLNSQENKIIKDMLGTDATRSINQYHEIFAETFSDIICSSISNESYLPLNNPIHNLKQYPKEFLKVLQKVINIEL